MTKIGEGDKIQVMIENREYSIRPKILTKVCGHLIFLQGVSGNCKQIIILKKKTT